MPLYYIRRACNILHKEGPVELSGRAKAFIINRIGAFIINRIDPEYHRLFRLNTWKNHLQNRIRYDAPPDPYKTINIRPKEIHYRIRHKTDSIPKAKIWGIGQIKDGNWDSNECRKNVENLWKVKGLKQRFVEEKSWKNTIYYNHLKNHKGYSEERILKRCDFYDTLYKRIDGNGYVNGHTGESFHGGNKGKNKLEILVTIGRDGQMYLWDGHHRFSIARILDLEVPAQVVCRHKKWQELRDDIYNNGLPETHGDLRDHPDLQDILD